MGKGRAVRTAMDAARGEILLIQDADLEYDPAEYPRLLAPIEARPGGRRLRLALRGQRASTASRTSGTSRATGCSR